MPLLMVLWSLWGVVLLSYILVKIYVMRLNRDEDDQLVLQETSTSVKTEQAVILGKLDKIDPLRKALLWGVIGLTAIIVVYYIVDMIHQFQQ